MSTRKSMDWKLIAGDVCRAIRTMPGQKGKMFVKTTFLSEYMHAHHMEFPAATKGYTIATKRSIQQRTEAVLSTFGWEVFSKHTFIVPFGFYDDDYDATHPMRIYERPPAKPRKAISYYTHTTNSSMGSTT